MDNLKLFQQTVCDGIVARFENVSLLYDGLRAADDEARQQVRERDGAVVLQAPTGSGKTMMAIESIGRFSQAEPILWFWFAPFAGLIEQARTVLAAHAPQLTLLDLQSDRRLETVLGGGVFVTTWAAVVARSADSRKARTTGDTGLAIDALIELAREQGVRIGCVVDEAHHGFHKAAQARKLFTEVLRPDYTLMMTATPRDRDALAFEQDTGYRISDPTDWASVSRYDAVESGLLKRGVRVVRFIARDNDIGKLIDFEHLALSECAAMHRRVKQTLQESGITLTPLMLVQVPDGKQAQQEARRYLVEQAGFSEQAVRVHTADEPDADLIALTNDPDVEVLIFKMAVALGFDAPRAFTLAALRGARDAGFGVQVIGRIVRVHVLLQGIKHLPELLNYGYVFLANAASQEGLLDAGAQINALKTQAPEVGTQTVITLMGDERQIQVARSGEPLRLLTEDGAVRELTDDGRSAAPSNDDDAGWSPLFTAAQTTLGLPESSGEVRPGANSGSATPLTSALATAPEKHFTYALHDSVPSQLISEFLPEAPADIEARLADHVDFSDAVLASRIKKRAAVHSTQTDVFNSKSIGEGDKDIWADLAPEAIANKAQQLLLRIQDASPRDLGDALIERFRRAVIESGAEPPEDEELLMQELDLVLVRNPSLLRHAYRRARHEQIISGTVTVPGEMNSDFRLEPAARNAYGVFPPDLGEHDELQMARLLDAHPSVLWWHRNPPRRPHSVGLYRWDEGAGFFPDFVVAIEGRETTEHIALLEVKGAHLWGDPGEMAKCGAVHSDYGRSFMAGRPRGGKDFIFLERAPDRLHPDGILDIPRMRWNK